MTIWTPNIAGQSGPKYRAIANAIIDAVLDGNLPAGEKLPPQRNLAYDLGVTLGTVTRAYQEVERAGLARGEVGRGTFVLPPHEHGEAKSLEQRHWYRPLDSSFDPAHTPVDTLYSNAHSLRDGCEMAANYPNVSGTAEIIADSMQRVARADILAGGLQYHADNGLAHHRGAGALWMKQFGIEADPNHILMTPGAQAATQTSLIALTRPGDTILAEQLTWPGLKATAAPLGLKVRGVEMDQHGMLPDAFERACRNLAPKAAYLLPTLHNPTAGIMPEERRRSIAEIAERHDVYLIEDDVYGFLLKDQPRPLFTFTSRLGIYITGLSKAVAPGLRIGYTVVPEGLMPKFTGAMRTNVLMASPITGEIATDLINSGAATEVANRQRSEIQARQKLVQQTLGNMGISSHPSSTHCWMPVPEIFDSESVFRTRLLERGVSVSPGSVFAADENQPLQKPHIRICLGAELDRKRVGAALKVISEIARTEDGNPSPVV